MAIQKKTLIELNEKELKQVLCKHFGLDESKTSLSIIKSQGDGYQGSYTQATLTGIEILKSDSETAADYYNK